MFNRQSLEGESWWEGISCNQWLTVLKKRRVDPCWECSGRQGCSIQVLYSGLGMTSARNETVRMIRDLEAGEDSYQASTSNPFSLQEAQRKVSNMPRVPQVSVATHCCPFSPSRTLAIAHLFYPFETYILNHWGKKTFCRLISRCAPRLLCSSVLFLFCFSRRQGFSV